MPDRRPDPAGRGSTDPATVEGFGFEWSVYDQSERDPASIRRSFDRYFVRFPWESLAPGATGLDVGSGSGRWSSLVLDRGLSMVALDASPDAASITARQVPEARVVNGSAVELPFASDSFDFGFSLGVLHHLPDTEGALREIQRVLRPGAPFLVYLYYAFDNRPRWFRLLWKLSDRARWAIAAAPERRRLWVTRGIAAFVYWPLSRVALVLERAGRDVESLPLSAYRHQPFYVLKTDALDRFGTQLEKRYTRQEIRDLLGGAGFDRVEFNEEWPFWCALARA